MKARYRVVALIGDYGQAPARQLSREDLPRWPFAGAAVRDPEVPR